MKINHIFKVIIIFLILISISCCLVKVYAQNYSDVNQFDEYHNWQDKQININGQSLTIKQRTMKPLKVILTIMRIIALGVAFAMAAMIAIKYMTTNSAGLKAQLKTDVPTYAVGCVLLFGAAGILTLIQYFMEDVVK